MTRISRRVAAVLVLTLIYSVSALCAAPKYVFYFIGDGMGINSVYGTEIYNAFKKGEIYPEPLNFSRFEYRTILSNYALNSLVTDSSAAGAALATGSKIEARANAMLPDGTPLRSIALDAKDAGFGSGYVTTVGINHATPASFCSQTKSRNDYSKIIDQLLSGPLDFAAGGGFISKNKKKTPSWWESEAEARGWTVLHGVKDVEKASASGKTIFLGEDSTKETTLGYAMESSGARLSDFTAAAISNLSARYPEGFFLMVEGGDIDHAAHENDAVCMFEEINDMARAVDLALEFEAAHPGECLIIVTSDHETGGFTIGNGQYELHPENFMYQKVTKGALTRSFRTLRASGNARWEDARALISDGLGLFSKIEVTPEEETALRDIFERTIIGTEDADDPSWYAVNEKLAKEAIDLLAKKAFFYFAVNTHTGAQVPLYVTGAGADRIARCKDQTEVANTIREIAGYAAAR